MASGQSTVTEPPGTHPAGRRVPSSVMNADAAAAACTVEAEVSAEVTAAGRFPPRLCVPNI